MTTTTDRECPVCGRTVVNPPIGRPRKLCSDECSQQWAADGRRLDREIRAMRRDVADAEARAEWRDGVDYRLRAEGLRFELNKLLEERALRATL